MSKKDDDNVLPMEMEALKPSPVRTGQSKNTDGKNPMGQYSTAAGNLGQQLCLFVKLWIEMNPIISSIIVFAAVGVFIFAMVESFRSEVHRNKVKRDYSQLELNYSIKASDLKNWCLFGGNEKCNCIDFTAPQSRLTEKRWIDSYRYNIQQVKDAVSEQNELDVVFVGDELVSGMAGRGPFTMAGAIEVDPDRLATAKLWKESFSSNGNSGLNGMALGIAGDAAANLLWRLQNGEMDRNLNPYLWWIWVGMNDLARGGCSEAATTLGIIRTAEELHFHDPEADIVIMGILPRAERTGGRLQTKPRTGFFHTSMHAHTINEAYKRETLWPSIQAVNKELRDFCTNHPKIVYFDASDLFLGSMGNAHFQERSQSIIPSLMPDYIHPSSKGYSVLMKAISGEVKRILYDLNEKNDIEKKHEPVDIESQGHD